MDKTKLLSKLSDIEWEDFELKAAQTKIPQNSWQTVSAFSNTSGGWLIFGVKQNHNDYIICGVRNPEKIEQDFTNTLRSEKFNIIIVPDCRKIKIENKTVLAFYIPLSDRKPVYYNSLANTYIRTGSGDRRATKEEIDAMYRDQAFGTHSSKTIDNSTINDISESSYESYREYLTRFNPGHRYNRLTKEIFLQKIRVMIDKKITISGLLTLGTEDAIQNQIPHFHIDYLEIPGTDYSNALERYTYRIDEEENLWEYFFSIFDRLRRHLDLPFKLTQEGFATEDYPQLVALREALVNLLMHSDYFSTAVPRVRVFYDRIEFFNSGALPKSLKKIMDEDISMPRNPIIAKIFRVVKLSENAGYGFDKMISGWKKYIGLSPQIDQGSDYTKIIFPLKKTTQKTTPKATQKTTPKISSTAEKILSLLREDPYLTRSELSARIGNISVDGVKYHLQKLKSEGRLKRMGGRKSGYWKIID